jgi:hypothetical protein
MISVKDISTIEHRRNDIRKELFKTILTQFCKKIKLSVEMGHTQVFLTVPEFVVGYPTFDRHYAVQYLVRQLELLGYSVTRYGDFDVYVTWIRHEKTKDEDMDILPSLVNLRKAADTLRKKHNG